MKRLAIFLAFNVAVVALAWYGGINMFERGETQAAVLAGGIWFGFTASMMPWGDL